ncbi:MAG: fasciclin domain-containing protein [Gammaproteobacteria bacterium]|nr:fasciclin domain-containing protein [Gammaproteobacteria bacterium]
MGVPSYFNANDTAAGDTNDQAVNNAWWKVEQEQVELQIQGSGVTIFDLYETNGVIHVIDTVITN